MISTVFAGVVVATVCATAATSSKVRCLAKN